MPEDIQIIQCHLIAFRIWLTFLVSGSRVLGQHRLDKLIQSGIAFLESAQLFYCEMAEADLNLLGSLLRYAAYRLGYRIREGDIGLMSIIGVPSSRSIPEISSITLPLPWWI